MAKEKGSQEYNGRELVFGELRMGFIREHKDHLTVALRAGKTLGELVDLMPIVQESVYLGMGAEAPNADFFDGLTPDEMSAAIRDMLKAIGYVFKTTGDTPSGEAPTA